MKTNLKIKAIELRKQGYSHGDIRKMLGIAKSTSALWTKYVTIPASAISVLVKKTEAARQKGRDVSEAKRALRDQLIMKSVVNSLSGLKINKTLAKLLCSVMYWGEGSKGSSRVVFTNSDPDMIKSFLVLFRYAFDIQEDKLSALLHLHSYHDQPIQKLFWSKVTNIPFAKIRVYNKKASGKIIRSGYPGCIAINYGDVTKLKELMFYYQNIALVFGGFV